MYTIEETVRSQQTYFYSGETKSVDFRILQLEKLRDAIKRNEQEILDALNKDLNKSEFESYSTEVGILLKEIRFTLKHLKNWVKPEKVKTPLTHFGTTSYIHSEPYGVCLIIAPWNYPFQLQLSPLVGAMAAGNCAILKPSELTPIISKVIKEMIYETYEERYVTVVEGGVEKSQELLKQEFDKIFFTGSVHVGKIVMEAASKKLIPITLELGGKSPVIVDSTANLVLAAKRIVWGKFTNAGQTCVAPDYLYVHNEVKEELIQLFIKYIHEFYGARPLENREVTHIVNENHFTRLSDYLKQGRILTGGATKIESLKIEPTIMDGVTWADSVMQEEIFGPILPILEFKSIEEVTENVRKKPKPLALYLFSESKETQKYIIETLSYGGGCINDTLLQVASPYLPFGGVGQSGTGSYHGKASFDDFSHQKSIVKQTNRFDIAFRYPSYKHGLTLMKKLIK